MDNYQDINGYGMLISLKRKNGSYIAPADNGIVRIDPRGRLCELGIDHNRTYKLQSPIRFGVTSGKGINVLNSRIGKAHIFFDTLMMRCRLDTDKGRVKGWIRLDVNSASEVVVTVILHSVRDARIDGALTVTFDIGDGFVESLNSKSLKLTVFENQDNEKLTVTALENIEHISVEGGAECSAVSVESVALSHNSYYNPISFKISLS